MNDLEEAWRWSGAVKDQLKLVRRIAGNYWDELPWDGRLGRDAFLGTLEPTRLLSDARLIADDLNDLTVVALFSVFEAAVRERVLTELIPEIERLSHPALRHAAREVRDAVGEGSFFRVLEPYKAEGQADLVEEVSQVRRYRNWVAHGRRGKPPGNPPIVIRPGVAYERLQRFLAVLISGSDNSSG